MTLVTAALICLATLRHGDPLLLEPTPLHCLVCGSRGLVDVVLNVLLFAPFGVGLGLLGRSARRAALTALALSLGVETVQQVLLVGRDSSLSDVLTNTVGALLGWALVRHRAGWAFPTPPRAARLAGAWWALWLALQGFTAWALRPAADAPGALAMRLPPGTGRYRAYEGIVLDARLDGAPVRPSLAPDRVRAALGGPTIAASARVRPSYPPGLTRPIVYVFGEAAEERLVLGQRGRELRFIVRTNAARVRLKDFQLALPGAFPAAPGGDPRRAPVVDVAAERTPAHVEARAVSGGRERRVRVALSPHHGWALVAPFDLRYGRWGAAFTLLWVAGWTLPLGYWVGRAARGARRAVALALLVALPLALVPPVVGFAAAAWWEWVGAAAGAALGAGLAAALRARARRLAPPCPTGARRAEFAS